MKVDRRTAIGWTAAVAGTVAAGSAFRAYVGAEPAELPPGNGYGNDPNLTEPRRDHWPLTLDDGQKQRLSARIERMLPAAPGYPSGLEVGLIDFFDEWLSAPYPDQRSDRALLLPMLQGRRPAAGAEARLRTLALAAYYTSPAGITAIGFIGNEARERFDPLPAEVQARLDSAFARLPERQP